MEKTFICNISDEEKRKLLSDLHREPVRKEHTRNTGRWDRAVQYKSGRAEISGYGKNRGPRRDLSAGSALGAAGNGGRSHLQQLNSLSHQVG